MKALEGQRTYIAAFGIAVVSILSYFGIIDEQIRNTLLTLLGAGGLAALRAAKK